MNMYAVVALTFAVIAFIFDLLMVAMPWWVKESTTVHSGLWEYCVSVNDDYHVCRLFESAGVDTPSWLNACAAMEFIGLLFVFVAMICGCLVLFCLQKKGLVYLVAWACEFISALFVLIGVIIYMCQYSLSRLHACFYLAWFGLIFSIGAGIFFMLAKRAVSHKSF